MQNKFIKSINFPARNAEILKSITPMFLAIVGAVIAIAALGSPKISNEKLTSAIGLAGTAISGAAGLSRSSSTESNSDPEK